MDGALFHVNEMSPHGSVPLSLFMSPPPSWQDAPFSILLASVFAALRSSKRALEACFFTLLSSLAKRREAWAHEGQSNWRQCALCDQASKRRTLDHVLQDKHNVLGRLGMLLPCVLRFDNLVRAPPAVKGLLVFTDKVVESGRRRPHLWRSMMQVSACQQPGKSNGPRPDPCWIGKRKMRHRTL